MKHGMNTEMNCKYSREDAKGEGQTETRTTTRKDRWAADILGTANDSEVGTASAHWLVLTRPGMHTFAGDVFWSCNLADCVC